MVVKFVVPGGDSMFIRVTFLTLHIAWLLSVDSRGLALAMCILRTLCVCVADCCFKWSVSAGRQHSSGWALSYCVRVILCALVLSDLLV